MLSSPASSAPIHDLDISPVVAAPTMTDDAKPVVARRSFASSRTISALILREMSTQYGRTIGGYFWAVFEPMAAVIIMALGFSLLIKSPPLGTDFFLFYASGYLPFYLYQQISLSVARAITFSRPLLFYPAVTWIDAVMARFLLNTLTGIMVTVLTLFIILTMLDTRSTMHIGPMISALLMALGFGFGVGVINCVLSGLYPIWEIVWSIITRPLFIASGILFLYEDMPEGVQNILWYNPLTHILGIFRGGVYQLYEAEYASPIFVIFVSLALSMFGLLLLRRFHREILENG